MAAPFGLYRNARGRGWMGSTQGSCVLWNTSWKLHPTKEHLYSHLFPISQTIQVIRKKMGDSTEDSETDSLDVCIASRRHTRVGRLTMTYISSVGTLNAVEDLLKEIRGSKNLVLSARIPDEDDDDDNLMMMELVWRCSSETYEDD